MRNFFNKWSVFFIIVAAGVLCIILYIALRTNAFSATYKVLG